ncbi:MAG: hypothetical protein HC778_02490 [Chamaesiphon sp. CSU_1_12]|nr:hypothetical protein [Chamaesiphon sp. CSU_1_12]
MPILAIISQTTRNALIPNILMKQDGSSTVSRFNLPHTFHPGLNGE